MKYLLKLKTALFISCLLFSQAIFCQDTTNYLNSINAYVKNYVETHEVVKGQDRKYLHFFPADSNYKVTATFEKIDDKSGFKMPSQISPQDYYRYGKISFKVNGVACQLTVYQSKKLMQTNEYKDYLFIPFTDATNGASTYEGGRYIDISKTDIANNKVIIDFNKAYNPYCCYTTGYNCPIPPKENALTVSINSGEMKYTKPGH